MFVNMILNKLYYARHERPVSSFRMDTLFQLPSDSCNSVFAFDLDFHSPYVCNLHTDCASSTSDTNPGYWPWFRTS